MLLCPFHQDKNPSLKIYSNTNTFHCFGCGKSGDVIEFIQLKEKCNKHEALLKATGLISNFEFPISNKKFTPTNSQEPTTYNHTKILIKIFTTFKNGLHSPISKKPKEYLQQRGLDYKNLDCGYNSGQFHHHNKLSESDKNACITAGLLVPYKGIIPKANGATYTPFANGCIIFPLKNKDNQIVSLYGRAIESEERKVKSEKLGKHYYLKNRSGLYPEYPPPALTKLILTESIIDAATLLQNQMILSSYGILACYGTNGLTAEHQAAIQQIKQLREIIFFFDGDEVGTKGIEKNAGVLRNLCPSVQISSVETPKGEDINSLAIGHESEIFMHLLENRKPFLLTEKENLPEIKEQCQPVKSVSENKSEANTSDSGLLTSDFGLRHNQSRLHYLHYSRPSNHAPWRHQSPPIGSPSCYIED